MEIKIKATKHKKPWRNIVEGGPILTGGLMTAEIDGKVEHLGVIIDGVSPGYFELIPFVSSSLASKSGTLIATSLNKLKERIQQELESLNDDTPVDEDGFPHDPAAPDTGEIVREAAFGDH